MDGLLYFAILFIIYFIPAIVAGARRHRQTLAIVVLNVFLGWSGLGWLVALVWSCTADVRPDEDKTAEVLRKMGYRRLDAPRL
jgi:hypothetical protein